MRSHQTECSVRTNGQVFVDVTDRIGEALRDAAVMSGRVTVLTGDDDSRLVVNEKESGLLIDMERVLKGLGPERSRALVGTESVVLPVEEGRLRLGTWQRVLLVCFPTPTDAARSLILQVIGY